MYKVYGPYTRKDGRKHVIHYDGTHRITQSYPRYLIEEYLGRVLNEWEHVDHIDNDFTNNHIDNLQILFQAENNRKSTIPAEMLWFTCPVCCEKFDIPARQYRGNQLKQGKMGPYCSKQCAGQVHN
jgi:HNH endonuclease